MKRLKITIHPKSHTIMRLRERLNVSSEPKQIIETLNGKFDTGFYDGRRKRVYVASLGYFGIGEDRKYKDRYFSLTFYQGLLPTNREPNASIKWFLDDV